MEKAVQPVVQFQAVLPTVPSKIILTDEELEKLDKDALVSKWRDLQSYVTQTLEKTGEKTAEEKLQLQQQEATRRENVLMMRLATKEQEMQDLLTQLQELKQAQTPSAQQLQTMLIDPAVNLLFEKMKAELTETKDRLEQAQNDLSAWKFTPDSVTGKKLMAKCRTLIQENQELGKQLSQGRIAQLEAELALQKKYSEELKGSQDEMNEFVIQLDEEVEGMQATICVLQQQLKDEKQHSDKIELDNQKLRNRIEELLARQPVNVSQDSMMVDTAEYKRSGICSPEKIEKKKERTNLSNNCELSSANIKSDLSPLKHDHFSPSSNEEQMDIDKKDLIVKTEPKKIDIKDNLENHPPMKTVKVITRSTSENLKNIENANNQYVSPPKGPKSSFSITELLSGGNDTSKKDDDSPSKTTNAENKTEENGENGGLNGEIDDSVI